MLYYRDSKRETAMKIKMTSFVLALSLALPVMALGGDGPAFSVFEGAVRAVAKENAIPLKEAVNRLRKLGVTGFDAQYGSHGIPELVSAGLTPVNFYGRVDLLKPETVAATTENFLSAAEKYGVKLVMILPPMFSGPDADKDAEAEKMLPGFRSFAAAAKKRGITATIEDFGFAENICSYSAYIRKILTAVPELQFTPDSGNLYCIAREQEDIVSLVSSFRDRIRHVHLKDFAREYVPGDLNETYTTLGLGANDNRAIVEIAKSVNYAGWYTLENPVGADTLADIARQTAVLKLWLTYVK